MQGKKRNFLEPEKKKKKVSQGNQSTCIFLMFFSMKTEQDVRHREIGTFSARASLKKSGFDLWVIWCTDAKSGASLVPAHLLGLHLPEQLSQAKADDKQKWISSHSCLVSPMLISMLIMLRCQECLQAFLRINECLLAIMVHRKLWKTA